MISNHDSDSGKSNAPLDYFNQWLLAQDTPMVKTRLETTGPKF